MNLMNLTIEEGGVITHSMFGDFSGNGSVELLLIRSQTTLQIYHIDKNDHLTLKLHVPTFCLVRSISTIRIGTEQNDYIVIGSDSGSISLLRYDPITNSIKTLHNEIFGKTGVRRAVPGEYISVDPQGRAVMIGSIEKQKLVYIFNRDNVGGVTITSPLEAHKSHSICYGIVGLDVGYDNPMFASIEVDYDEQYLPHVDHRIIKKNLVLYELDLGLNHVTRKHSEPIHPTSNYLIPIPSVIDGVPLGLFICSENEITWYSFGSLPVTIPLPRRDNLKSKQTTIITSHITHVRKGKHFILLQNEFGDLLKITFTTTKEGILENFDIVYFDTIPSALNLCLSKRGHLFCPAEYGDSYIYRLISMDNVVEPNQITSTNNDSIIHVYPLKQQIENFEEMHCFHSLSPLTDLKVSPASSTQDVTKLYAFMGKAEQSCVKILKNQLQSVTTAEIPLPAIPLNIWSLKQENDEYDQFLVLSYSNITTVLQITEDEVTECTSTPLLLSTTSVYVGMLYDGTLLQVLSDKIIVYTSPPQQFVANGERFTYATTNGRDIIVSVQNGDSSSLLYYQYKTEFLEIERKDNISVITSLSLDCQIPSKFCAISCIDNSVHILSLFQHLQLKFLLVSCHFCFNINHYISSNISFIGLSNGIVGRTPFDEVTGDVSDPTLQFVGAHPVELTTTSNGIVASSRRALITYGNGGRIKSTSLDIHGIVMACSLNAPFVENALAVVCDSVIKIITVNTSSSFTGDVKKLWRTPRKTVVHPEKPMIYILVGDKNSSDEVNNEEVLQEIKEDVDNEWVGGIQIFNATNDTIGEVLKMEKNCCPTSGCVVRSQSQKDTFLVIGTVTELQTRPRQWKECQIRVYRIINDTIQLEYVNKVESPVRSMCEFRGSFVAGVGNVLRLYEIGKKTILKKAEQKGFSSDIAQLHCVNDKLILTGVSDGFSFIRYIDVSHKFDVYADSLPRWVVAVAPLDETTVLASDKFGSSFSTVLQPQKFLYHGSSYKAVTVTHFFIGDIVTAFARCSLVPGSPPVLLYGTLTGGLGALVPLQNQRDADFYQHLELHMRVHWNNPTKRNHISFRSSILPVKDTVDGDLCELFDELNDEAKQQIADEMEREVDEISRKLHELRQTRLF
ncbi:Pre-mRNA-splicing factor rse-1 [Entamoeba marina]